MNKKCLFVMGFVTLARIPSFADRLHSENRTPVAVARLKWTKIRGRVATIDSPKKTLAISDRDGNITDVLVDEHVQILRSYRVVDFDVLKPQDRVELRYLHERM